MTPWILVLVVIIVTILGVAKVMADKVAERKRIGKLPEQWRSLRRNICPNCYRTLAGALSELLCPNCGLLTPTSIQKINILSQGVQNCCSFCGGQLEQEEEVEDTGVGHVPGAGEPVNIYTRNKCIDCGVTGERRFVRTEWWY